MRLAIWVRRGDEDKCGHAMASLKKSMRWDEEVFGLEYDLDVFNIVAVSDFNMGAMENKGLNVFNTRYVLAKPETATDTDYQNIEAVIAHEYFHNWTGNRVTCRDWFQLSLKEGLTVFRDQLFSADQGSPAVCRIGNVRTLRAAQFPEDAGPLAHPVQPRQLSADRQFLHGDGLQQRRRNDPHDPYAARPGRLPPRHGCVYRAATTIAPRRSRIFVAAMQEGSGVDLGDFALWYRQAGTPEITVEDRYDPETRSYELDGRSNACRRPRANPTNGRCRSRSRWDCSDRTATNCRPGSRTRATARTGTRVLVAAAERAGVSLRRRAGPAGAVAAAQLLGPGQAAAACRSTGSNFLRSTIPTRWPAGTPGSRSRPACCSTGSRHAAAAPRCRRSIPISSRRCGRPWPTPTRDPAFAAEALALPSEAILADEMPVIAVEAIHAARESARAEIAAALAEPLSEAYRRFADRGPYRIDGAVDRPPGAAQCLPRLSRRRRSASRARGSPRRSSTPAPT